MFYLYIQKSTEKCSINFVETTVYLLMSFLLQRYNKVLAAQAQAHADSCVEAHSGLASENMFFSSGLFRSVFVWKWKRLMLFFKKFLSVRYIMYVFFIFICLLIDCEKNEGNINLMKLFYSKYNQYVASGT